MQRLVLMLRCLMLSVIHRLGSRRRRRRLVETVVFLGLCLNRSLLKRILLRCRVLVYPYQLAQGLWLSCLIASVLRSAAVNLILIH